MKFIRFFVNRAPGQLATNQSGSKIDWNVMSTLAEKISNSILHFLKQELQIKLK